MVAALESLLDGEGAVTALVAMGEKAVAPLSRFLLDGRPGVVFQPKMWAVQALAALGARHVLMEYLDSTPPDDPQLRYAEEAVRNTALREFARWPDPVTQAFLLEMSRRVMLPGLVEALGRLRLAEAIPFLDRALEDDVCRPPAETALAFLGPPARAALILSAANRLPRFEPETPSSLRRRQAAIRILSEIGIEPEDWPALEPLLRDEDPEIAVRICSLAVKTNIVEAQDQGIPRLIELSGVTPWYLNEDVVQCLLAWRGRAWPAMEREVEQRLRAPKVYQVQDQTLRLLRRVMRLARDAQ